MATIKNFGFISRLSGPGGTSSLEGVMVGNRKRRVQFAEQMGIYVQYDKFEQPVQIGQSKVIFFKRLKQHRRDHLRNRWSSFSWLDFSKLEKTMSY